MKIVEKIFTLKVKLLEKSSSNNLALKYKSLNIYIHEGLTLTTINVWVCHTHTSYMYSHFRMFLRFLLHVLFCILHPSPYLNEHYQRSIMNFSQYKYQILRKICQQKKLPIIIRYTTKHFPRFAHAFMQDLIICPQYHQYLSITPNRFKSLKLT